MIVKFNKSQKNLIEASSKIKKIYNYQVVHIEYYENNVDIYLYNNKAPNYNLIRITTNSIINFNTLIHINEIIKLNNVSNKLKYYYNFVNICFNNDGNYSIYPYNLIDIKSNFINSFNNDAGLNDYDKDKLTKAIENANSKLNNQNTKISYILKIYPIITYTIICICILNFILYKIISLKYDSSTALILLGADYKTFTLGLKQYYRLLTTAFSHGSIIHLLCNVLSLYSLGSRIEFVFGKVKYIILLLLCSIAGSLSAEILTSNTIIVGISSALYGLLAFFILDILHNKQANILSIMSTILINLSLNFLPNVAWQGHLGGAIAGICLYYLLEDENKTKGIILTSALFIGLFVKFFIIKDINPIYAGTDFQVIEALKNYGFNKHASNLLSKLYDVYIKYGG